LLSTEVVWGNGDIFRTGAVARPGTLEEQWELGCEQDDGSGPGQADYYRIIQGAQGTMGIVTWAALRCERLPMMDEPFIVGSSTLDNISEFAHWLIRLRLANECLVLNNSNLAAILAKECSDEYRMLRESLPSWVLFFCVGGYKYLPEERVSSQIGDILDIARRAGVEPVKSVNGISASEILRLLRSPSTEPYWKLRSKGSCQDIFFLTTRDKLSDFTKIMYDTAVQYDYPIPDIGVYLQPVVQGTSYHCEFNLFFNPQDAMDVNKVRRLSAAAAEALIAGGAFFSRPYGLWADMAYRRDAETTAVLRKVKKIFDPNDIMNPGKLCF
jgi:FAD/FMN-containing dehydrogenase